MSSTLESQIRKIGHRSSSGAQKVLLHYVHHQKFPELIDLLENMPGRIYQSDVINAFASILVKERSKPNGNGAHAASRDEWQPLKPVHKN